MLYIQMLENLFPCLFVLWLVVKFSPFGLVINHHLAKFSSYQDFEIDNSLSVIGSPYWSGGQSSPWPNTISGSEF